MAHVLIITGEPDDPWEVDHPEDCPTAGLYGGMVLDHVCTVGRELSHTGLPSSLAGLPPGRYDIEYWEDRWTDPYGRVEVRDAGIVLLFREETALMGNVDPAFWRKILFADGGSGE